MSLVEPFGDRAALVRCADREHRSGTAAALSAASTQWSVRQAALTVLVVADRPDPTIVDSVMRALSRAGTDVTAEAAPEVVIGVQYDGPDLEATAAVLGMQVEHLVQAHTTQAWVVDSMGFAPGFGYLVPDGEVAADWTRLSRRDSPRARVPAGAVAVAAGMSAVYPSAMPGGWNLLGRTTARLFDAADAVRPSLLTSGVRVRFEASAG